MFRVMNNFSHELSIISEMVLLKTFPYNELISMPFTPISTLLLREMTGTNIVLLVKLNTGMSVTYME